MEPDDFQLISSAIIQTVQVTVLDDGLPITEDKTITLTLTFSGIDTDDVFLDEALLIIPARQGRWLNLCNVIGTLIVLHQSGNPKLRIHSTILFNTVFPLNV